MRLNRNSSKSDAVKASEQAGPSMATSLRGQRLAIFGVLVLIVIAFAIISPDAFATRENAANLAADAAVLLVLGVGMTFVILTAGIDLSIGSVLTFAGVVAAETMAAIGGGGAGAIVAGSVAGVIAGGAWGALNGWLITKAKVPPLIVTLGSLGMALGATLLITGGIDLRDVPPGLVTGLGNGSVAGIPWLVVIALIVTVLGAAVLRWTVFGRYTYAIGSNPAASRQAGIRVDRHLLAVYTIMGLLAGLAGTMTLARFAGTTISGNSTVNLAAIAAVVIGGTSLFGGAGTVLGTVVGVLIPAVLQNGFVIVGVPPFWQQIAVGAVLIFAVYLDQLRRSAREHGR